MDWITFTGKVSPFLSFQAVQSDGHLSSHLGSANEIDLAAAVLKHQIDVAANQMKLVLQKKVDPFGGA